jgi:hypothetical protein
VKLWVLYKASWAEFERISSPVLFTLVEQVDRNFHVASFRERDAVDDDVLITVAKVHSGRRIKTENLVDNAAQKRQFLRVQVVKRLFEILDFFVELVLKLRILANLVNCPLQGTCSSFVPSGEEDENITDDFIVSKSLNKFLTNQK